jgi:hypothetical protein
MNSINGSIFIGSVHEARNADLLRTNGVRSILGLIDALAGIDPADLGVIAVRIVPLVDGEGNEMALFRRAVTTLSELVEIGGPVLVHCQAGWSRSPAVVSAYLVQKERLTAEQALAVVPAKRSCSMTREMRQMVERFSRDIL